MTLIALNETRSKGIRQLKSASYQTRMDTGRDGKTMQDDLARIDREIAPCERGDYFNLRVPNSASRIVMRTARELGLTPASRKQTRRKPPGGAFLRFIL